MAEYTDDHRLLLQFFFSHKVVRADKLGSTFPDIDMTATIATINERLQCVYMDIKSVVYDEDGQLYYGIVNSKNDVLAQKATPFSPHEIELFKAILDNLVREGELTVVRCSRLVENAKLTHAACQQTIDTLVQQQWLSYGSTQDTVVLGVRAVLELRAYLEETMPELTECTICSEIVFKGERCSNDRCEVKMHMHCSKRWFESKDQRLCPVCRSQWPE